MAIRFVKFWEVHHLKVIYQEGCKEELQNLNRYYYSWYHWQLFQISLQFNILSSVMKPKHSQPVKKSKSKHKKLAKNRSKQKHFDPVAYLNAHLELKDIKSISAKKKHINTKRPLTSALSIKANPPDTTLSFSKIRSKSSHDHYKKNPIVPPFKYLLSANLGSIITEQDNVQFTEVTPRDCDRVHVQPSVQLSSKKMRQQRAAIVIQRAWKNYQTLKMIKYYYKKYSSKPQKKKINPVKNYSDHPDLQKTLKIKRNKPKNDIEVAQTQIFRAELQNMDTIPIKTYTQSQSESDIIARTPTDQLKQQVFEKYQQFLEHEPQNGRAKYMQPDKRFNKIKKNIQQVQSSQSENMQKQKIEQFIWNFQMTRQKIQRQFERKIQFLFGSTQRFDKNILDSESKQSQQNCGMLANSNISYQPQIKPIDLQSSQIQQSQNSLNWYYQSVQPEYKIFEARLQVIKQKKQSDLKKVQSHVLAGRISFAQGQRRTDRINGNYQLQKRRIQSNKKSYAFSTQQLTRNALSCHKELNYLNKSQKQCSFPLRNCFSSESVILKSILKETQLRDYCSKFLDFQPHQKIQISYYSLQKQEQVQIFEDIIESSESETPSPKEESLKSLKSLKSIKSIKSVKSIKSQKNKQIDYDKIQQYIFETIVNQLVRQIYLDQKFFVLVKPYIQQAFQFKKIVDYQIDQFLVQLRQFFPKNDILMKRINQKLNPSSLQILKIIRNCDYQAEDYEVVLGQEIFKSYRKAVEKKYQLKKIDRVSKLNQVSEDIDNLKMVQKLVDRRLQKINKLEKYTNFQRDLFLMYMKAVFSSLNELIIQGKSYDTYMNTRSSIGPGQLTLALKQYNKESRPQQAQRLIQASIQKINSIVRAKCSIPSFTNYNQLQTFQRQISKQIRTQLEETQFKWVNLMDETLEIWQETCVKIQDALFQEFIIQLELFQYQ